MSTSSSQDKPDSIYASPSYKDGARGHMVPCVGCAKEIHCTASVCPNCGASQRNSRYKSKGLAAVFAFFLGGFGAHRFYLGQWWGVFYLLFFWAWIPGLIAFIEFIVFLCTKQTTWDDKYNEGMPATGREPGGGVAIALVVIFGGVFFVAMIGILAAIALPAYQDYTGRARVAEVITQVQPIQREVESFYQQHNMMPLENIMVGLDEPLLLAGEHSVLISDGSIEVQIVSDLGAIDSETMVFVPLFSKTEFRWGCKGGSLPARFRPSACRAQ